MRKIALMLAVLLALAGCGRGTERATEVIVNDPAPTAEAGELATVEPTDEAATEEADPPAATPEQEPDATSEPAATTGPPAAELPLRQLGEQIELDGATYTLDNLTRTDKPDQLRTAEPGQDFYILNMRIQNTGSDKPVSFNPLFLLMSDSEGYHYGIDVLVSPDALSVGKLERDQQIEGLVAFRAPEAARGLAVHYTPLTAGGTRTFSVALDEQAGAAPPPVAGQKLESDGIALAVASIEPREKLLTNPAAGKEYLIFDVAVDNLELESLSVNPLSFKLIDSDGAELSSELSAGFRSMWASFVPKGQRNRGLLAFEVAEGASTFTLVFQPNGRRGPKLELPLKR